MSEWITDRLPPDDALQDVWFASLEKDNTIYIGVCAAYSVRSWIRERCENVIAWMPCPKPDPPTFPLMKGDLPEY